MNREAISDGYGNNVQMKQNQDLFPRRRGLLPKICFRNRPSTSCETSSGRRSSMTRSNTRTTISTCQRRATAVKLVTSPFTVIQQFIFPSWIPRIEGLPDSGIQADVEIWMFRSRVFPCILGSSAACSTSWRRGLGAASAGMRAVATMIIAGENFIMLE